MVENPIELFRHWYDMELEQSKLSLPSACCLSTIGLDGYPNARYVSLKGVKDGLFVIAGPTNSRKGSEIERSAKVSIVFWWTETERQIRIQGDAKMLSELESEIYFGQRSQESKIVSTIFDQGREVETYAELEDRFNQGKENYGLSEIRKPPTWSGFGVTPRRMEFMEFLHTRLHKRMLFTMQNAGWDKTYLEP